MIDSPTIRIKPGSQRAQRFDQVFGRLTGIPVVHSTPYLVTDPGDGKEKLAYVLNTSRLTATELTNLVSFYAALTNIIPDEVRSIIKSESILIDAADCEVEVNHAA